MRKRGIQLRTFLGGVTPTLLARYFDRWTKLGDARGKWFHVAPEAFLAFAADPSNSEVVDPILEDFESIDELCREGPGLIIRAYHRFGLAIDDALRPYELAMLLFLDHPEVFGYARSHYLLFGGGATLSIFMLASEQIQTGDEQTKKFAEGVQTWFQAQAMGEHVKVNCYRDDDQVIFLVQRGMHLETRAIWESGDIVVSTQRPAAEDVLIYDPRQSQLRLRSALERDRVEYLRLFAVHMGNDESLASRALREQMFSLEPVTNGKFNFRGRGPIKRIDLVGVKLKLHGVASSVVSLRADEVRDSLKYDLKGLSLKSGDLLIAKFRFHIQLPGEKASSPMTFFVQPPSRTNIGDRRNGPLVLKYLEDQGVKLLKTSG